MSQLNPLGPGSPSHRFRQFAFGIGCVIALFGLAIGFVCLFSAFFPGGSGEWEGVGQLAALVLQIPAGLAVVALAFSQPKGRRRSFLLLAAIVILLLPVVTVAARHARSAWYQRQFQRSLHLRTS